MRKVCNRNILTIDGAVIVKNIYVSKITYFSVIVKTQL